MFVETPKTLVFNLAKGCGSELLCRLLRFKRGIPCDSGSNKFIAPFTLLNSVKQYLGRFKVVKEVLMILLTTRLIMAVTLLLIAIMVVFLKDKTNKSIIVIKVAAFVQSLNVALTIMLVHSAANDLTSVLSGAGVLFAIFFYLIPSVLMLNFILCAIVYICVSANFSGKLKIWISVSLISYGVFLFSLISGVPFIFLERLYEMILWISFLLWIPSALIVFWTMFIHALKIDQMHTERSWIIIAFLLPIFGSLLYISRT